MAVWLSIWGEASVRLWLLVPALVLVGLALVAPKVLRPLNRAWFQLGLLLNKIVSPLIMDLLFYVAIVPMGFVLRKRGIDLLRLRRQPDAKTYWIERDAPGQTAGSLTRQF